MVTSNKTTSKGKIMQLALMAAACFAIGSIGLLIAVLMEHSAASVVPQEVATTPTSESQANQTKQALIQSMQAGETNGDTSANSSGTGTPTQTSANSNQSATASGSASQSPSDISASSKAHAEKLKLINEMKGN